MADLFFWMATGAAIVWTLVIGIAIYASVLYRRAHPERHANALIVGGGVIFPAVVLTALLFYGLAPLPKVLALPPAGGPVIAIIGEQWWWRVRYTPPGRPAFELANEIRLPVGQRVEVQLSSADVIHSFWVPPLAGKMDAVPGRLNKMALEPTRTGIFRGACAEFCGSSHALMAIDVVVLENDAFTRWVEEQQRNAVQATGPQVTAGQHVFLATGCGACHTVRGTAASGVVGPDLTHLAGRLRLGAGTIPNTPGDLQRWITATDSIKPGVHMPTFNMLKADELVPLAAYLSSLR